MPTDQREEIEIAIQQGIPIYSRLNERQEAFVVELVKQYGKEAQYLDGEGAWVNPRETLIALSKGLHLLIIFGKFK